jgi:hypothetical protein
MDDHVWMLLMSVLNTLFVLFFCMLTLLSLKHQL